jgi:hypothetical protein
MSKRKIKCEYCGLYCDDPWELTYHTLLRSCEQCGRLTDNVIPYCDECTVTAVKVANMDIHR